MSAEFVIAIALQAILCSVYSAKLASEKNYSPEAWGFAGFFFGPFALIAAAGLPSRESATKLGRPLLKNCPQCAEEVRIEAITCSHCGHSFGPSDPISQIEKIIENSPQSRPAAIGSLCRIGTKEAVRLLNGLLSSTDHETIWLASNALIKIGSEDAALAILKHGPTPKMAYSILKSAADEEIIAEVINVIKGDDPQRIDAAIKVVSALKQKSSVPMLCDVAQNGVMYNRLAAIEALGDIGDPSPVHFLVTALLDDDEISEKAREALLKIGSAAIPALEQLYSHKDSAIQKYAEDIKNDIHRKEASNEL